MRTLLILCLSLGTVTLGSACCHHRHACGAEQKCCQGAESEHKCCQGDDGGHKCRHGAEAGHCNCGKDAATEKPAQ